MVVDALRMNLYLTVHHVHTKGFCVNQHQDRELTDWVACGKIKRASSYVALVQENAVGKTVQNAKA